MTDPRDSRASKPPAGSDDLDVLTIPRIFWRQRWVIGALVLVAVATTGALTLRLPKIFAATATMLTPREGGGSGLLANPAVAGLVQQAVGISLPSLTPNRDLLLAVLQSRRLRKAVVEHFHLQERYREPKLADAIEALRSATKIVSTREGLILLTVETSDPQLAADIANFYIEELDRTVAAFGNRDAVRQREFVGEQVERSKRDLEAAESELRRFQERHRAIVLEQQTGRVIQAAAELKGQIMAAEVQLQVMRSFATDANPEVASVRRRIDEMRRQLVRVEYGRPALEDGTHRLAPPELTAVPFAKVPELTFELARLTRDVKVQETLVALLSQQYEQTKIIEAREMPAVQVLDAAVVPERPSKPSLRFNLTVSAITSLLVGVLTAFIVDHFRTAVRRQRDKLE